MDWLKIEREPSLVLEIVLESLDRVVHRWLSLHWHKSHWLCEAEAGLAGSPREGNRVGNRLL